MNKIGCQFQGGSPPDIDALLDAKPASILLLGLALNVGLAQHIRDRSPSTLICLRYADLGDWTLTSDWTNNFIGNALRAFAPFQQAGLADVALSPNEPIIQNDVAARTLNDLQVNVSNNFHAAGYKVCGFNFSVGNPDFPLWPYLLEGLNDSDYLGLHEYAAPRMDAGNGFLTLRYRKIPVAHPPILITECGIDGGTTSSGKGGYRDFTTGSDYCAQLKWYATELAKDDYVKAAHVFLYGRSSDRWKSWDLADDESDRAQFIAFVKWAPPAPAPAPPPPAPTSQLLGIDISKYQGDIDFNQLQTGFVIVKATEGVGFTDPKFARNQSEARRVGLPLGYYHFARPDLNNAPAKEADWFLDTLGALQPGEVLALDFEVSIAQSVTWSFLFLKRVELRCGVKPLVYLNQSTLASDDWSLVVTGGYGLWLAAYNGDPTQNNFASGAWPFFAMRQWSSSAQVPGIGGQVDADVFFGDAQAFKRYGSSAPSPTPTPEDKMITAQEISENIPFLANKAQQSGAGAHVYGERLTDPVADGKRYRLWVFDKFGVGTEDGHYAPGEEFYFDPRKAFVISKTPPVVGTEPILPPLPSGNLPYKFPGVLTAIGALGEEGQPVAGEKFYRLTGAAVNRGVSAFCAFNVYGKNGIPVVGAQVVNLRPDGKGEIGITDASGKTQFNYAAASAFTDPGTGPFTVFIATGAAKDEDTKLVTWDKKLSDTVKSLGDFQGTHTEINLQMVEQA